MFWQALMVQDRKRLVAGFIAVALGLLVVIEYSRPRLSGPPQAEPMHSQPEPTPAPGSTKIDDSWQDANGNQHFSFVGYDAEKECKQSIKQHPNWYKDPRYAPSLAVRTYDGFLRYCVESEIEAHSEIDALLAAFPDDDKYDCVTQAETNPQWMAGRYSYLAGCLRLGIGLKTGRTWSHQNGQWTLK